VASSTSSIAVEIACDKEETKNLLEAASIPVPRGRIVYDEEALATAVNRIGYPVVLKPVNGNHGRGATINVQTWEQAVEALATAKRVSRGVIVEKFITGADHRLLVVNYRFVAGAKRTPAMVTGNGKSTLRELIDEVNSDPRRAMDMKKC
jgi:cyanophycin synthetase